MDAILRGFPEYFHQSNQRFVNTWTMAACDNNNNNNNNNNTFNTHGNRVSVLPVMSGVSPYVSTVSPAMAGVSTATTGVSPYVSSVSPSTTGVSPYVTTVSPAMTGVSPYMSTVSPAMTGASPSTTVVSPYVSNVSPASSPSVLPIGLFNGETLSRNQERKGSKRTRRRPMKQKPVKRFAPNRQEESSSNQAPAQDGFEPRTAATTNFPLNFNTISHFNENEDANSGNDVIDLTHERANMRCDEVASRHMDSSRSKDNSCFAQNEMLELHPLTNFGAQSDTLENMQTGLQEKNDIPSLGSLAKFCVDSLDLTSLSEPGLGSGETKNTPETPNPPNLTTLELTELVEFLADDLGPTGNGTTSLQQADLQVKPQLPETTSGIYTAPEKLVHPVASARSGRYSKVPESLNSINSGITQHKLNQDSVFGLTPTSTDPALQDLHGVTVASNSASRHQTSLGVRPSGSGHTLGSDLGVLGRAAEHSRVSTDGAASQLVHHDVKSSLKKKLDYNLQGAVPQILPLTPKDKVAQSSTVLPQTTYTAISQTAHNPISQTAHNHISQKAHNPISQTARNVISQTAHNPISQTTHNPVSQTAHNPISQTTHNPIFQASQSSVPQTKAVGSSVSQYDTPLISHSKIPHPNNMPHASNGTIPHATNMPHSSNSIMPHANKSTMPQTINNTVHHNFKSRTPQTTPTPAPHTPRSTHTQSPPTSLSQYSHTSPLYRDVLSTGSRFPSSAPTRGLQTSSPLRFSSRDGTNTPRPQNNVTCQQPHAHTAGQMTVHNNIHTQSLHNNMIWSQQPHTHMHQQPNAPTHPHTTTQQPHTLMHQQPKTHTHPHTTTPPPRTLTPNPSHTLVSQPQHTSNTTPQIQRFTPHTSPHQPRVLHPHTPPHLPTTQTPRQTPHSTHQPYTPHHFTTQTPYTTHVTTTPTTTHTTTQHNFTHNTTIYNHHQQPTHPPSVANLTPTPTPHSTPPYPGNNQSETPPPFTPPNIYPNTPPFISNEPTQPEIVPSIPEELPSNLPSLTLDNQFSLPSLSFDDLDTTTNVFEKKSTHV